MQCEETCWCLLGTGYKVSSRGNWRQHVVGSPPNIFSEDMGGGGEGLLQAFENYYVCSCFREFSHDLMGFNTEVSHCSQEKSQTGKSYFSK